MAKKTTKKKATTAKKTATTKAATKKKATPKKKETPKKKAAPKKTETKKATTEPKKEATTKAEKNGKLTSVERKILEALRPNTSGMQSATKDQIQARSGLNRISAVVIGAGTKDDLGVHGSDSLAGRGLVKVAQHEGQRKLSYYITPKGKKLIS